LLPCLLEEDSRGRGGKQKSVLETGVSTMRTNETRSEERKMRARVFPDHLFLSVLKSKFTRKTFVLEENFTSRGVDRTSRVFHRRDKTKRKKKMCYISSFVNARYVQNDFELNKSSSRARKNSALIALYIIAALPYRSLISYASESHNLSRTQIQRFDKQIDMFGCPISLRAADKRLPNDA